MLVDRQGTCFERGFWSHIFEKGDLELIQKPALIFSDKQDPHKRGLYRSVNPYVETSLVGVFRAYLRGFEPPTSSSAGKRSIR